MDDVGSDVEILELGVASVGIDDQRVLLDDSFFLLLFRLASFKPLLNFFDEPKRRCQVGRGRSRFTRFL